MTEQIHIFAHNIDLNNITLNHKGKTESTQPGVSGNWIYCFNRKIPQCNEEDDINLNLKINSAEQISVSTIYNRVC